MRGVIEHDAASRPHRLRLRRGDLPPQRCSVSGDLATGDRCSPARAYRIRSRSFWWAPGISPTVTSTAARAPWRPQHCSIEFRGRCSRSVITRIRQERRSSFRTATIRTGAVTRRGHVPRQATMTISPTTRRLLRLFRRQRGPRSPRLLQLQPRCLACRLAEQLHCRRSPFTTDRVAASGSEGQPRGVYACLLAHPGFQLRPSW